MSQLIALIIAIALGAIVTAIGYVFLGDAFTKNSEKGVALQFINQASQVEMAMTAYRAENARTAFDTSWALTQTNAAGDDGLVFQGYLKSGITAPQGDYTLVGGTEGVFLVSEHEDVSDSVCQQINKVAGFEAYSVINQAAKATADTNDEALMPTALVTTSTLADAALNGHKFSCTETFGDSDSGTFIYEVE